MGDPTRTLPGQRPGRLRGDVVIRGITKSFGVTPVLRGIDLAIGDGEFVTILGPSGCGKSTLLRIIAGLEVQDDGVVEIGGAGVDQMRPDERDVAMVFQSYALYPHLTVFDNLALPLRMRAQNWAQRLPGVRHVDPMTRASERRIRDAVTRVAAQLQMEPLLGRRPGQLSGGQKQRVALGRAMVRSPRVFLMDEPLSNLDAELRVHMRAEIAQLHRRLGVTFVYVTHDQAEAMTMSDRIVVMMSGEIIQAGTPDEIYNNPQDVRVARFVGSPRINLVAAPQTQNGQIGFRPGQVRIATNSPTADFRGHVVHRENLGSDVFAHVAITGSDTVVVVRHEPGAPGTEPGTAVGLHLTAPPLRFDATGRRLAGDRVERVPHG